MFSQNSKVYIPLISIYGLNLISCLQTTRFNVRSHSASEPAYHAVYHLQPGDRYHYTVTNKTTLDFEVNGNETENINSVKASLILEIIKDTTNASIQKITYEDFDVELKSPDHDLTMNSQNAATSIDPVEKMLGLLKGGSILVTINSKGQVVDVQGYRELTDKIMNGITVQKPSDKELMRRQLQELFGEKFIKTSMEQDFRILPDSSAYVGDSWTKSQTQLAGLQLNVKSTYTLESLKGKIASIDVTSAIVDSNSNFDLMGSHVNANLQGTQEGSYEADTQTGILISGESQTTIKGTLQVQYRDVPLTIKEKKTVAVNKI